MSEQERQEIKDKLMQSDFWRGYFAALEGELRAIELREIMRGNVTEPFTKTLPELERELEDMLAAATGSDDDE